MFRREAQFLALQQRREDGEKCEQIDEGMCFVIDASEVKVLEAFSQEEDAKSTALAVDKAEL